MIKEEIWMGAAISMKIIMNPHFHSTLERKEAVERILIRIHHLEKAARILDIEIYFFNLNYLLIIFKYNGF